MAVVWFVLPMSLSRLQEWPSKWATPEPISIQMSVVDRPHMPVALA